MLSARTPALNQRLLDLSDNELYDEAVALIRRLVDKEGCAPLPTSQVMGLLNIANAASYSELERFIQHQRERDWPPSKRDIKTLYTELEKSFRDMRNRRLRSEFHLLSDGLSPAEANQEVDEIMAALAHEFIQHLVAENGVLAAQRADEQRFRRK
jgi:hypothetical protein